MWGYVALFFYATALIISPLRVAVPWFAFLDILVGLGFVIRCLHDPNYVYEGWAVMRRCAALLLMCLLGCVFEAGVILCLVCIMLLNQKDRKGLAA